MGDRPVPDVRSLEPLPRPNPKLACRVINGEAMILTPHDSVLHTLNPVATRIWQLLPAHEHLGGLVAAVAEEFEAPAAEIEADTRELLDALREKRIVE